MDLKKKEGTNIVRRLCCSADVLLEPYRPGESLLDVHFKSNLFIHIMRAEHLLLLYSLTHLVTIINLQMLKGASPALSGSQ